VKAAKDRTAKNGGKPREGKKPAFYMVKDQGGAPGTFGGENARPRQKKGCGCREVEKGKSVENRSA